MMSKVNSFVYNSSYFSLKSKRFDFIVFGLFLFCEFDVKIKIMCREEKKKGKTWRNEVNTKTVKIATSEIHISILKMNFTIL